MTAPAPLNLRAVAGIAAGIGFTAIAYGPWVLAVAVLVLAAALRLRPQWRARARATIGQAGRLAGDIVRGQPSPPAVPPVAAMPAVAGPSPPKPVPGNEPAEITVRREAIDTVFEMFGTDAKVARWTRGPAVTRFEVVIGDGVRVNAVTALVPNIGYATGCTSIRVLAPIPGRSAIGLELANSVREIVQFADVLASKEMADDSDPLRMVAGVSLDGQTVTGSLGKLPHLLIAGTTGAGKSSALNSLLCTLLHRTTPQQVRLLLIDPKRVELSAYTGVPHLLRPVVTSPQDAISALEWLCGEMDRRYGLFAAAGVRDLAGYNKQAAQPLPFLVTVADEIADLMMLAKADVEKLVVRLAQLARAAGIHLVLATQRPSVDVVTGLIKANMPSRWGFAVASNVDSRTVLDQAGAEQLLGAGDSLWLPATVSTPIRVQAPFTSDADITAAVAAALAHGPAEPYAGPQPTSTPAESGSDGGGDADLLRQATAIVTSQQLASVSLLQRRLRIGYTRAGRILDQLETLGVVGPPSGRNKTRTVLVPPEPAGLADSGPEAA